MNNETVFETSMQLKDMFDTKGKYVAVKDFKEKEDITKCTIFIVPQDNADTARLGRVQGDTLYRWGILTKSYICKTSSRFIPMYKLKD